MKAESRSCLIVAFVLMQLGCTQDSQPIQRAIRAKDILEVVTFPAEGKFLYTTSVKSPFASNVNTIEVQASCNCTSLTKNTQNVRQDGRIDIEFEYSPSKVGLSEVEFLLKGNAEGKEVLAAIV